MGMVELAPGSTRPRHLNTVRFPHSHTWPHSYLLHMGFLHRARMYRRGLDLLCIDFIVPVEERRLSLASSVTQKSREGL